MPHLAGNLAAYEFASIWTRAAHPQQASACSAMSRCGEQIHTIAVLSHSSLLHGNVPSHHVVHSVIFSLVARREPRIAGKLKTRCARMLIPAIASKSSATFSNSPPRCFSPIVVSFHWFDFHGLIFVRSSLKGFTFENGGTFQDG